MSAPPCVYRCYNDKGLLLYIGATGDWETRKKAHAQRSVWFDQVWFVGFSYFDTYTEALAAETRAINDESPRYNVIKNRKPFIPHDPQLGFYLDEDGCEWGDVQSTAEFLGITKGAVRDAVARGKLKVERRGGTEKKAGYLRFSREDVTRYKEMHSGKRGNASPDYPRKAKERSDA